MKGISIRQPWASLILAGSKTIEVRTRPILFRGDLLICAGKSPPVYPGLRVIDDPPLPLGVALCIVEVFDCQPMRDEDWDAAKVSRAGYINRVNSKASEFFGWRLRNVRPVEQFAVKGQLSLFNVPDILIQQIFPTGKFAPDGSPLMSPFDLSWSKEMGRKAAQAMDKMVFDLLKPRS